MSAKETYESWQAALLRGNWQEKLTTLVAEEVNVNGMELSRDEFESLVIQEEETMERENMVIDVLVVDESKNAIGARVLLSAVVKGKKVKWEEVLFVYVDSERKMSKVQGVHDFDAFRSGNTSVEKTSPVNNPTPPPEGFNMKTSYEEYIQSINDHTMTASFPRYVIPHLHHNFTQYSREQYASMIESSFDDISGLNFTIEECLVDEVRQQCAVRLGFTGTPVKTFRGIEATGREVRLWEHVIYRWEGGRVERVWSVLDLEAYRGCLKG